MTWEVVSQVMLGLDGSSWLSGWSWSGCCWGVCCSMQVGWSAMDFKLLPLFWVSEWVSLCMSPLRVKSQFPATLLLSGTKPCWVSKPDTMGADLTQCWFPGLECLMCGSNSLLLTEEPCICDFPSSSWVAALGIWVLTQLCLCFLSYSCFFFISFVETLSC